MTTHMVMVPGPGCIVDKPLQGVVRDLIKPKEALGSRLRAAFKESFGVIAGSSAFGSW